MKKTGSSIGKSRGDGVSRGEFSVQVVSMVMYAAGSVYAPGFGCHGIGGGDGFAIVEGVGMVLLAISA